MAKYSHINAPTNTLIWGCFYTEIIKCKPVQGKIHNKQFVIYRRDGTPKFNGRVYIGERKYADTYEECVEVYNKMIDNEIDRLKNCVVRCEEDRI